MVKPFAQRHTVTGLEFAPIFISSKEANTKLPKVIIVSPKWVAPWRQDRTPWGYGTWAVPVCSVGRMSNFCCSPLDFSKERKSMNQVLELLRQARNCYWLWYMNFSLASLLTMVTKQRLGEVVRTGMPSPPSVQWRERNKRRIYWWGLGEKWYLRRRDEKMYK